MNYVNNRIIPGTELPVGNTPTAGEALSEAALGRAAMQSQTVGEDLMRQLIDNLSATNNRPASQTILQALNEAGLPANTQNQNLVSLLLSNEMPISKDTLREFVTLQKAYPTASSEALVAMRASDIPINSQSVTAVTEFLSNEQIISSDINELVAAIEQTLSDPAASPELTSSIRSAIADTVALLGPAVNAVPAEGAPLVLEQNTYRIVVEATPASLPEQPETEAGGETLTGEFSAKGNSENAAGSLGTPTGGSPQDGRGTNIENAFADRDVFDNTSDTAYKSNDTPYKSVITNDTQSVPVPLDNENNHSPALDVEAPVRSDIASIREKILNASPQEISKLIKGLLSADSKEITKDSVRKLYETGEFLFGKIREAVESHADGARLAQTAQKASDDVKLLNQLNSMYPQIEIPLKFDDPRTSGSLYVYANKKRSRSKDSSSSALLHLSMPALGPVDIKLTLKANRLSMNFYTEDMAQMYLKADLKRLEENLSKLDLLVSTLFKNRSSFTENRAEDRPGPVSRRPVGSNERLSFDIRT